MVFAANASHATTLLSYSAVGKSTNLIWTEASKTVAGKTTFQGGTLSTPAKDLVSVTTPGSTSAINAYLILTGTSTEAATSFAKSPTVTEIDQLIDTGTFSFVSASAFTFDGVLNPKGTVILSGSFSDAMISGSAKSSQGNVEVDVPSVTAISTGVKGWELGPSDTDAFDLSLTGIISPGLVLKGNSLASFKAVSAGTFTGAAVPEPASWAMMLIGFGGMGAAMRSRRKGLVAAI